jgi:hypothetical protein
MMMTEVSLDELDPVDYVVVESRRARSSRPPRWPSDCRGQACSSASASKRTARIGSGSTRRCP